MEISIYLPYNKISNMIYMVNYNLVLNILNIYIVERTFELQVESCIFIYRKQSLYPFVIVSNLYLPQVLEEHVQ